MTELEMRFLIDTDICSYAMGGHPAVIARWHNYRRGEIGISAVTEAELRFGIARRRSQRDAGALERFLQPYEILEFSTAHAPAYAELRVDLERRGMPIGKSDMFIAAQAIGSNLVVVTNNEREFRRVPGLKIENWAA